MPPEDWQAPRQKDWELRHSSCQPGLISYQATDDVFRDELSGSGTYQKMGGGGALLGLAFRGGVALANSSHVGRVSDSVTRHLLSGYGIPGIEIGFSDGCQFAKVGVRHETKQTVC